jgi:hypothetical protein
MREHSNEDWIQYIGKIYLRREDMMWHTHYLCSICWVGDALVCGQGTVNFFNLLLSISCIIIQERKEYSSCISVMKFKELLIGKFTYTVCWKTQQPILW